SQPILLTNNGKNFNKSKSGTGGGIPITALTSSVPNHRLRHRRQVRAARDCSRLAVSRRSRETRRHSAVATHHTSALSACAARARSALRSRRKFVPARRLRRG